MPECSLEQEMDRRPRFMLCSPTFIGLSSLPQHLAQTYINEVAKTIEDQLDWIILNTCELYHNSTMTSKIASCLLIVLVNVYSTSSQANTTTAPTNYRPITNSTTYISTINAQTTGLNTSGLNATTTDVEEYSKTGIETQSPQTSIASVTMSNLSTSVMTSGSQTPAPSSDSTPTFITTEYKTTQSPLISSKLPAPAPRSDSIPTLINTGYETTQSPLISSTFTTSDSQTTNLTPSVSTTTDKPKTTFNFNTTRNETPNMLEIQLKEAYIKSFLNMSLSVKCDDTICDNRQDSNLRPLAVKYECSTRPKLNLPATDDTQNGLTNDCLGKELEPTDVNVSEASFNTNEQEQSIEQSDETPPTPIERPLETFPLPVQKNVYVDLTETTRDPIYVNKSAEVMRPGRPGT
ncbi:flocculation protein FLO11-like [Anneissia japonica]|uniref:flocculation protein FLO11-like n=1 Tax=Anneissia japonica TaxID=1529436 RepID=UPI001425BAD5|nr:flocculation protein FLO11-like [Anneissia japonica]